MDDRIRSAAVALAALAATTTAHAVPVQIDFTSNTWSAAQGQSSHTQSYGGIDVTLSAGSGMLTFNDHEAPSGYDSDGIGVGDDEIGSGESIRVTFSSNVTVLGYALLDLMAGEGPQGQGEQARVEFADLGIAYADIGTATGGIGSYVRSGLGLTGVSGISFLAAAGWFNDFALASVLIDDGRSQATAVAEPGTAPMLAFGLLSLALAARRRGRS
jgi:hypothetical protein